jgi:hypothetical protein
MLSLLINKFKKVLIILIAGCMLLSSFTSTSYANESEECIKLSFGTSLDDQYIKYKIYDDTLPVTQMRDCEVIIRAGEHQGKAGKRVYLEGRDLNIPEDVPLRNDYDGKGPYVSEWDINMKETKALVRELRNRGVNAQLQTSYNKSTDLNAAGRIANKSNPYLYISLHHNYYAQDSKGYFAMYNPHDELGKHVAKRLSNSIQNNGMVPQRDNQYNTGYIGELNEINPSTTPVLLELGFFSNPTELEIICSDQYVNYVSNKLADEIVNILNTEYR